MKVTYEYDVYLANGDGESGEWEEELGTAEQRAFLDAVIDGADLETLLANLGVESRVYDAVLSDVGGELMDALDPYDDNEDNFGEIIDEGCDVSLGFCEPDFTDDEMIEALIFRAVDRAKKEGAEIITQVLDNYGYLYTGDASELALGYAINHGCGDLARKALNDGGDLPNGAENGRNGTENGSCRFAVDAATWEIIVFTQDMQRELFDAYLTENGYEEEEILRWLDDEPGAKQFDVSVRRTLDAIGMYSDSGWTAFFNMTGRDGAEAAELAEWLGYTLKDGEYKNDKIMYL